MSAADGDRAPAAAVSPTSRAPCTLRALSVYFLRLGTFGFGGPIALAASMERDLVERRRWVTREDYSQGLALAQLSPGPLAAQLAMYVGWIRAGTLGASVIAAAFILPSFLMVLALATAYVRFGGLPWMQGAFYGIGAAVIAILLRSVLKLVRRTIARDGLLWTILALNAVVTAWTEREIVWVFAMSGILALVVRAPLVPRRAMLVLSGPSSWLLQGVHGVAAWPTLVRITTYFGEAGVFVFGSGLAIVPFLHGGVVSQLHWLDDRQFLDAVAVAMITPGPVVITVAFIGYLVAGLAGALAAAVGVFLPCYLFVVVLAPHYRRYAENRSVKAFVSGVVAAACGAITGAAFVLGRRAIIDLPTAAIFVAALVLLSVARKLPEPLVVLGAGVAGVVLRTAGR